jgi:hypothetical protein
VNRSMPPGGHAEEEQFWQLNHWSGVTTHWHLLQCAVRVRSLLKSREVSGGVSIFVQRPK